ncbi:hypothetical protein GSI_11027 [Ganoderma sinense ZZ0214-1]|uniref:Autophagy-related protein 14 n=1 Tax=Ganoderma sinense ZZ0214-1 TaxID=1077348 RepID=A0A2G8RZD1_9APHY|nr:hypothetical protein GSI_11027 [Ganoderma sinense ZZ0214-1]
MECQNCELKQRQFYCENCLKQHLLSLRLQTQHAATDRDAHIASAQNSLKTVVDSARLRRAQVRSREERVQEIWEGVNQLRTTNQDPFEIPSRPADELSPSQLPSSTLHHPPLPLLVCLAPTRPDIILTSERPATLPPTQLSLVSILHAPGPIPNIPPFIYRLPPSRRQLLHVVLAPSDTSSSRDRNDPAPELLPSIAPFPTPWPDGVSRERAIEDLQAQMVVLSDTIARARSGLVQELVEVFSVVEVGGRPPIGGKAGTKGEWTIGGLVLPVPGDIRRYPPDHINAVLTHTIHFVTLLAFYLGIKLPFEVVWSRSTTAPMGPTKGSGLLGVGIPWIGAIRGGESGGWARWSTKQPLHVSSAPPPASSAAHTSSPSSSPLKPLATARPLSHRAQTTPPQAAPTPAAAHRASSLFESESTTLADSTYADAPPSTASTSAPGGAFTTALAMLLYDVCFVAHTQAVDVPLAHAGDVLGNLWAVCCAPELGRRAHATRPLLAPPTAAGFGLDFSQLLQATAATPARAKARGTSGVGREIRTERIVEEDEEGWDLLEADADSEFIDA